VTRPTPVGGSTDRSNRVETSSATVPSTPVSSRPSRSKIRRGGTETPRLTTEEVGLLIYSVT